MKKKPSTLLFGNWLKAAGVVSLLMFAVVACKKEPPPVPQIPGNYNQINLVANTAAYNAKRVDPFLKDAWGIAFSAGGTAWISARGAGKSVVYNSEGLQGRTPVDIPSPGGAFFGSPTGQVFSGSATDFLLPANPTVAGSVPGPARFIFVGVDGVLSAWKDGNLAFRIQVDPTAAYTGLAINVSDGATFLYAANFRSGKIDTWDKYFKPVSMPFVDPALPQGYAPFNIQAIADKLYVTYAKVGPTGVDVPGPGNGYVTIFDTKGSFFAHFASKGPLNSPWGVAPEAPANFIDGVQTAILIGNFGDGRISAFSPTGEFLGQLKSNGKLLSIEGLWAISYVPATATTIDKNRLYFAAGPNKGEDGMFGYIAKATLAAP